MIMNCSIFQLSNQYFYSMFRTSSIIFEHASWDGYIYINWIGVWTFEGEGLFFSEKL